MARHRHAVNVRVDGLAVVLGPLLGDSRIAAAALVDVDSGMVLDAWCAAGRPEGPPDLELMGAQHAEVLRCALALLREWPPADGGPVDGCELVLESDGGTRHLLRTVPDPHGDRLALAVVVDGPQRVLDRVRKRLRSVAVDALTAGPSTARRPVRGLWSFAMPDPKVDAPVDDAVRPGAPEVPERRGPERRDPEGLGPEGLGPERHDPERHEPVAADAGRDGPARTGAPGGGPPLPEPRAGRPPAAAPAPPVATAPRAAPPVSLLPRLRTVAEPVPRPSAPAADGTRRPSPPAALPSPPRPPRP